MLVDSPRLTSRDREQWARDERIDAANARRLDLGGMALAATREIRAFLDAGSCYAGVSWGKDSVVVADLIARAGLPIPLVWVRVEPVENLDCVLVRDAFRALYPEHPYDEIEIACERHDGPVEPRSVGAGSRSPWLWAGTLERGFALAAERHGARYVSGVRAAESGPRKARMRAHGVSTARTCAPIGWWSTAAAFAYLHARGLPAHPAYAMTAGGGYPRDRLRVAALGGSRGAGIGRREWERAYYPERMAVIDGWRKPQ